MGASRRRMSQAVSADSAQRSTTWSAARGLRARGRTATRRTPTVAGTRAPVNVRSGGDRHRVEKDGQKEAGERGATVEAQDGAGVAPARVRGGAGDHRRPGVGGEQPAPRHPFWLLPLISTVLLVASIAVYEGRNEPGLPARILSFALGAVLVAANAVSLVLLIRGVFVGSGLRRPELLFTGLALWLVNVAVFALLYWELDGGGPEARADGYRDRYPDLVFPQQQADQQGLAPPSWKPSFYDYAYVSFTASIAFSPTDAMPYSRWAKAGDGDRERALVRDPGRARGARGQHRSRLKGAPCAPAAAAGAGGRFACRRPGGLSPAEACDVPAGPGGAACPTPPDSRGRASADARTGRCGARTPRRR